MDHLPLIAALSWRQCCKTNYILICPPLHFTERLERLSREKRARQREVDKAAALAEANQMRSAETKQSLLLRKLIRAFQKGEALSENENPNSVLNLQRCAYLRQYDRDHYSKDANQHATKKSSWRQKSLVGFETSRGHP